MNRSNEDIRQAAKKKGIFFWQIADKLGISESTLYRKLRYKLPKNERKKIMDIIEELSKEVI